MQSRRVSNAIRGFAATGLTIALLYLALRERKYEGKTFGEWFEASEIDRYHPSPQAHGVFLKHQPEAVVFLAQKMVEEESGAGKYYRDFWKTLPGWGRNALP